MFKLTYLSQEGQRFTFLSDVSSLSIDNLGKHLLDYWAIHFGIAQIAIGSTHMHGMGDVVPVLRKERLHIEDICCLRYLPFT